MSGYQNTVRPVKLLADRLNELNNPGAKGLEMSEKHLLKDVLNQNGIFHLQNKHSGERSSLQATVLDNSLICINGSDLLCDRVMQRSRLHANQHCIDLCPVLQRNISIDA